MTQGRVVREDEGIRKLIYLHEEVMEWVLGRPLKVGEVVIHKNGDVLDCDPANLELLELHKGTLDSIVKSSVELATAILESEALDGVAGTFQEEARMMDDSARELGLRHTTLDVLRAAGRQG
jgi:HNH endonuclease